MFRTRDRAALDHRGSTLVQIVVATAIVMGVIAGVMSISNFQQKVFKTRQKDQDFRQFMNGLGLLLQSPETCKDPRAGLGGLSVAPGAPARIVGRELRLTGRDSLKEGALINGVKVSRVALELRERVGTYRDTPTSPSFELWVASLQAQTTKEAGVGSTVRTFEIPLTVFLNQGRVATCNSSDSLVAYSSYYNPGLRVAGVPAPRISLAFTPHATPVVRQGEARTVRCAEGEFMLGAAYRFRGADPNRIPDYLPLFPVETRAVFKDQPLTGPQAQPDDEDERVPRVKFTTTGTAPGCEAFGGQEGGGTECVIYCAKVNKG